MQRRGGAVRWSAIGSLLLVGVLPLLTAFLHDMRGPRPFAAAQPPTTLTEVFLPLIFHITLALVLLLTTRPSRKEDRS